MNFNWILINKFAIGTPPLNEKDLLFLKEKNIISIFDLRNEFDFKFIGSEEIAIVKKNFCYLNAKLPDHNSRRYANNYEIENCVNLLNKLTRKGAVFMHCHAAMERSPLISIAFLHKFKKLSLIQAYEYIKQQNPSTSVSLDQLRVIESEKKLKKN